MATPSNVGRSMGLGAIGGSDIVFKRKYRWTFEVQTPCGPNIPESFVKLAARPNLTIEETEINFLHGKMWIPGKGSWETITVTYYDVANVGEGINGLYSWLATVYNFTDPIGLHQSSRKGQPNIQGGAGFSSGYAGLATLRLYDGCGKTVETWLLGHMWPQAVNFGELDYSSSEEVVVELTLRYAEVQYIPGCGIDFPVCCKGCD